MAKTQKKRSIYGVHPGVRMIMNWIAALKEKTGKSLEQWVAFAKKNGPEDATACRQWLKEAHGFGTYQATWLADYIYGKSFWDTTPEAYLEKCQEFVDAMFAGPKAGLKPLYDTVLDLATELGDDVKACPCQTIVPLYRNHVFAELKPTTRTRLDLSFALRKFTGKIPARLADTKKPPSDRLSHKIGISQLADIDDEVRHWLRVAYDLDQ